jgi:hypothetical protein
VKDVYMDVDEKAVHDLLLANRPNGADHDPTSCAFCTKAASKEEEKNVTDQAIFTQEQHEQLLASAVETASAEAAATADAEILTLNEQLDAAKAQLVEEEKQVTDLETKISDRDEQARLEELAGERVAAVKAVANFTNEQIEERQESWAKMSEEDFAAYLEDIQAVAKAAVEKKADPPKPNFDGTRSTAGEDGTEGSVVKDFFLGGLSTAAQS